MPLYLSPSATSPPLSAPRKGDLAKGGLCRHDFMKVCIEWGCQRDTLRVTESVLLLELFWEPLPLKQRAKKAHKLLTHKLFLPPFAPRIVPGTNWVCPRDKLVFSQGQAGLPLCKMRRKTGFVPGTKWVCHRDNPGVVPIATGSKSSCLCVFFLPDKTENLSSKTVVIEKTQERLY